MIQDARIEKGLTTPELAELVGVTDASVTQTEAGQTIPRKPTIAKYEEHLGVPLMDIRKGEIARRKAQNKQGGRRVSEANSEDPAPGVTLLKLEGYIAAGEPIESIQSPEWIEVPASWGKSVEGKRALRIKGDSMWDMNIQDGDLVIVGDADHINRIVAANVPKGGAYFGTVKIWHQINDKRVSLRPANPKYKAKTYDIVDVGVYGVVFGVIRQYDYTPIPKTLKPKLSKKDGRG